jgi:hypothetical protein
LEKLQKGVRFKRRGLLSELGHAARFLVLECAHSSGKKPADSQAGALLGGYFQIIIVTKCEEGLASS